MAECARSSRREPDLVTDAAARARALGFEQSADPDVGRLLAVLAAGVRPGGRILEIGTGTLDATIDALEPGGLLVVDDMQHPTVTTVPDQAERTGAVRAALLADPHLLTVQLDWSTGVMLARRV